MAPTIAADVFRQFRLRHLELKAYRSCEKIRLNADTNPWALNLVINPQTPNLNMSTKTLNPPKINSRNPKPLMKSRCRKQRRRSRPQQVPATRGATTKKNLILLRRLTYASFSSSKFRDYCFGVQVWVWASVSGLGVKGLGQKLRQNASLLMLTSIHIFRYRWNCIANVNSTLPHSKTHCHVCMYVCM